MWSEVMDADAFAAFEEAGDPFDPATAARLERFILSAGGSEEADVLYTKFRGRMPGVEPLLKGRGLLGRYEMVTARMITDIEDFFTIGCGRCDRWKTPQCSASIWAQGLLALRAICRDMGLEEHVKWAHPCYMHAGRNIVSDRGLAGRFPAEFFNAGLMKDPDGLMERQGPKTKNRIRSGLPMWAGGERGGDTARLYRRGNGLCRDGDSGEGAAEIELPTS